MVFLFTEEEDSEKNKNIRELVAEIKISKKDLVMPYFIIEDDEKSFQVNNMPVLKDLK